MRQLSPEEAELWARVTATIAPLSREEIKPAVKEEKPVAAVATVKTVSLRPSPTRAPRKPQLGSTLDSTWDRRLRSGSVELDRIIDLHGMNLDQAWRAIDRGLDAAIARGNRVVLLITGHHRPGEAPVQRGRIRAAINDWLGASRHAGDIAAVRGAHRRHGGGGSLYIILRRR
jgi:DNA-nicking Smr family endonuclease